MSAQPNKNFPNLSYPEQVDNQCFRGRDMSLRSENIIKDVSIYGSFGYYEICIPIDALGLSRSDFADCTDVKDQIDKEYTEERLKEFVREHEQDYLNGGGDGVSYEDYLTWWDSRDVIIGDVFKGEGYYLCAETGYEYGDPLGARLILINDTVVLEYEVFDRSVQEHHGVEQYEYEFSVTHEIAEWFRNRSEIFKDVIESNDFGDLLSLMDLIQQSDSRHQIMRGLHESCLNNKFIIFEDFFNFIIELECLNMEVGK